MQNVALQRQPFELTHGGVVAGQDDAAAGFLEEKIGDDRLAPGHGQGQGLQDQHVVVSIHDEAGQLVRFRPDEAPGHAGNRFRFFP